MEPPTQVRLLRALEAGEVLPVGAARPVKVDVRIVSATNRNLETAVSESAFRDDLFWRLRGVEVTLPPLRDRGDDVMLLARHFLEEAAGLVGRRVARHLEPAAADALYCSVCCPPPPPGSKKVHVFRARAAFKAAAAAGGVTFCVTTPAAATPAAATRRHKGVVHV